MTNETQISKTAARQQKTEISPSPLILVSYAASHLPHRVLKAAAPVFYVLAAQCFTGTNRLWLKWHKTSCLKERHNPVYILRFVWPGSKCCDLNYEGHYFSNYVNIEAVRWGLLLKILWFICVIWAIIGRNVLGLFPLLHNLVFCLLRLSESQDYFLLVWDVMYLDRYVSTFHRNALSPC